MTFPESGSRIDAAAKALWEWEDDGPWEMGAEASQDEYRSLARRLLVAADEAQAPFAEKLAAALEVLWGYCDNCGGDGFIDERREMPCSWCTPARELVAEFRASAPVENRGK